MCFTGINVSSQAILGCLICDRKPAEFNHAELRWCWKEDVSNVRFVVDRLEQAYGMKSVMSILKRQRQELSEDEERDVPPCVTSFLISEHTSEHVVRLLRLMRVSRGHVLLIGPPHVQQVPMVYFAAEVAGYHVTHIDGGLVESVKDARTTYWKAAILEAVHWVLMNPASHLMLVVSQISDLPIKYVRILEELVASGDGAPFG